MDAAFFESNGRMRKTMCPLAAIVSQRLKDSPYFNAKSGHDHTVIFSINQNMNYFLGAKNCIDFRRYSTQYTTQNTVILTRFMPSLLYTYRLCWNCTKLAIDDYMFIAADRTYEMEQRGANWHAIPFPSDYHYNSTGNVHISPPWTRASIPRKTIISFTGSPRRYNDQATLIREALIIQCKTRPTACQHGSYKHDGESPNQRARESVFCLQPPGDMPTRKSLFDAVLSGCIPVLFHPLTAKYMYEWHFGQKVWDEIGLHFDSLQENKDIIAQKLNVIKILEDVFFNKSSLVLMKQQRIAEVAHTLQYSLITEAHNDVGVKKRDAYDVAMDNVLAIHSGKMSHNRTSDYILCQYVANRAGGHKMQTADWCNKTDSTVDPFYPPAYSSPLYNRDV